MNREDVLACYARAVAPHDGIKIRGAKSAYTAINGNMFSFVDDTNRLCLRFSELRKAELNEMFGTTDVIQYGAVMRGYVAIPPKITGDEFALHEMFVESLNFARGLRPKATQRKPKP